MTHCISITIPSPRRLRGVIEIPGDKSISHRAVIFNAVAEGNARITHFLAGADCLSSIACMRALGVKVEREPSQPYDPSPRLRAGKPTNRADEGGAAVRVYGVGLRGLAEPA